MKYHRIFNYQYNVAAEHLDSQTGEINCTKLAEDSIDKFNDFGKNEQPHFDTAVEVAEIFENNT